MPRPIRQIEIYLPLDDNGGVPIEARKFLSLQDQLLKRFGGVTCMQRQFPLQGLWFSGDETYSDRVVIFSVLDFATHTPFEVIRYLEFLKKRLKKKFDQLEILITVQELLAV